MPLFNRFVLAAALIYSTAATAQTSTTLVFSDLATCKAYFSRLPAADKAKFISDEKFCSDKIGDAIKLCLATKINDYVKQARLRAFSDLTNSEQMTKEAKFKYECQREEMARQAAANAAREQAQANAAAQAQAQAQANAARGTAGGGGGSASSMQQGAQVLNEGLKISDRIDAKIDKANGGSSTATSSGLPAGVQSTLDTANKKIAQFRANGDGGSSAPVGAVQNTSAVSGGSTQTFDDGSKIVQQNLEDGSSRTITTDIDGNASVKHYAEDGSLYKTETLNPQQAQEMINSGQKAQGEIGAAASEAKAAMPGTEGQVDSLAANADGSKSSVPTTEVTTAAKAQDTKLTTGVATAINTATPVLSAGGLCPPFASTVSAMQQFNAEVNSYVQKKQAGCEPLAEKTQFLCVEGTSPGAIAAKELMNSAGPIISLISSAQKTCSSTAKVTKMVSTGLTIAAGVCVAAKMACNAKCTMSTTELSKLKADALAKIQSSLQADTATAQAACSAQTVYSAACWAQYAQKAQAATAMLGQINTAIGQEASPVMGTSSSLVAKCNSHVKDVIRFGVQLLGTAAAQKNAAACEKQLAASGNPGITAQQYCEKKENAATEWCKCQANPQAQGCPNAIAKQNEDQNKNENNGAGTNIRQTAGNSGFAGGFKPSGSSLSFDKNGNPTSSADADSSAAGPQATAGNGSTNGSTAASSGSGTAAAAAVSGSAADAQRLAAQKAAEKKWSFAALSSGGLFGGGNSANGKNANKKGGTLDSQKEAIERQIASERFAAEVSSASGKSNWEKVKQRYLSNETTLLVGQ